MKLRKLRKVAIEKNGWPVKTSWRDKGEYVWCEDGEVRFHRITCARFIFISYSRQSWRAC